MVPLSVVGNIELLRSYRCVLVHFAVSEIFCPLSNHDYTRQVEDDWVADRETQFDEEAEDGLPLDMLDADIDWENSAFAGVKRRHDQSG